VKKGGKSSNEVSHDLSVEDIKKGSKTKPGGWKGEKGRSQGEDPHSHRCLQESKEGGKGDKEEKISTLEAERKENEGGKKFV